MWIWLTFALLFGGCIKKNRLPCWVNQPCKPFKAEEYLIGVGKGENQQIADDEAIAALSQKFQFEQKKEDKGPPKMLASFIAIELNGIKVVKKFQKGGVFYALATLERGPLLAQLDKEINKLHQNAQELHKLADKSSSKIDKAHLYHQAVPLLKKIELLNEQREIVDFENKALPIFSQSAKVDALEKEVLRRINISLSSDPTADEIKPILQRIFQKQGFQTKGPRPDLLLKMTALEGVIPSGKPGFTKIRYQIQFNIKEPGRKNRMILLRNFTGEGTSKNLYTTHALALSEVREKLLKAKVGLQLKNTILGERP